jgi:hypothetical protein
MIKDHLEYEEQHALEAILRHHLPDEVPVGGLVDYGPLKHDLATFINWMVEVQKAKTKFGNPPQPPYLLALLGQLGIYGREVVKKP